MSEQEIEANLLRAVQSLDAALLLLEQGCPDLSALQVNIVAS